MTTAGLAPIPTVRLLLDVAARGVDGTIAIAGRRVVLRRGVVVDVEPSGSDPTFEDFLVRAGRLTEEEADALRLEVAASRGSAWDVLLRSGRLGLGTLREVRRALWLERLVRALREDERDLESQTTFLPEAPIVEDPEGVPLTSLLLDALSRRAAEGDAEAVGARADHQFVWQDGPHRDVARRWSGLAPSVPEDAEIEPVALLLARSPSAPSRIAALVRAGLARLVPAHAPPPDERPEVISAPRRTSRPPELEIAVPAPISSLPPAREPSLRLDPGEAPLPDVPADLATPIWRPPTTLRRLDDPLDPIERRIARLEQSNAPGPERAAAFRELAAVWQRRYGSLEEAARAYREAAAADPEDPLSLDAASVLCAAMGRVDLATAYAQAAAASAKTPSERGKALRRFAEMALRSGNELAAIEALRDAARIEVDSADAVEWLLRICALRGDLTTAVAWARVAASRLATEQPERARALLDWAHAELPTPEVKEELALQLAAEGFGEASAILLAEGARASDTPSERLRLLLAAAERAEAIGRPDLAADRLFEALAQAPTFEVLYEPLASDAAAAGDPALLAEVLETLAALLPDPARAEWLTAAGEAHLAIPGQEEWGVELLTRALERRPELARPRQVLRAYAEQVSNPGLFADALERAARSSAATEDVVRTSLLIELATLAEERLDLPERATWALERVLGLRPDDGESARRLEAARARTKVRGAVVHLAERELGLATPEDRPKAARTLAALLRDCPDDRERAIGLYREVFAADPNDAVAASSLERLLRLAGEERALAEILELRLEFAHKRSERLRILIWLSGIEAHRENPHAAAHAARAALSLDPPHAPAAARLERLARLGHDAALLMEALGARAASAPTPRARARFLTELARTKLEVGALDDGLATAREALIADPQAAEAQRILLDHLDHLPPEEALDRITQARASLGASASILLRAAELAGRLGRREELATTLEALSSLDPLPFEALRARLELAIEARDPGAIVARAEALLHPERWDPRSTDHLRRALDALDESKAIEETTTLALLVCDRWGDVESEFAQDALERILRSGRDESVVAALERLVVRSRGNARVALLERLADVHGRRNDLAAEARTRLRILALAPRHALTLERLFSIYASTGEDERLMAVLVLRLDTAEGPDERQDRLADLAVASALLLGDIERTERFLATLIREASDADPRRAAERAAGILVALERPDRAVSLLTTHAESAPPELAFPLFLRAVAIAERAAHDPELALRVTTEGLERLPGSADLLVLFERIALAIGDVAKARGTYERLIERAMGLHGRRALLYRMARWLERAGDKLAALDAYVDAFTLAPNDGTIFQSLTRLGRELAAFEIVGSAELMLAARATQLAQRVVHARRAAEIASRELDDPSAALSILEAVWLTSGKVELLAELRRVVGELATRDPAIASAARSRFAATLEAWAEASWDPAERLGTLRALAELHAIDREDFVAAGEAVDRAPRDDEENPIPIESVAMLECDLVGWLADADRLDEARERLKRAAKRAPGHPRVEKLAQRLGLSSEAVGRASSGGRVERLGRDALPTLLEEVRRAPGDAHHLRRLHTAAEEARARAVVGTTRAILSLFDSSFSPEEDEGLARLAEYVDELPTAVRGERTESVSTALQILWEAGNPLFRRRLTDIGVVGTERIQRTSPRPIGRILDTTLDKLRLEEVTLFVRGVEFAPVRIEPTWPATVVLSAKALDDEEAVLRFRLGRALTLAQPAHVLVATSDERGLEEILEALSAAFGPADAGRTFRHESTILAADLWRTLSARDQARLRECVAVFPEDLSEGAVRDGSAGCGARAGLLAAGAVAASIRALALDEPELVDATLSTEKGFREACSRSQSLMALLRFAFSERYLAARAQAMNGR